MLFWAIGFERNVFDYIWRKLFLDATNRTSNIASNTSTISVSQEVNRSYLFGFPITAALNVQLYNEFHQFLEGDY